MTRLQRLALQLAPKRYRLPLRFVFDRHEDEMALLPALVHGGVAIDVGANYGTYSYALARCADRVEAFEPQPWCAEVLEAYAARNARIRVHRVALSDRNGDGTLTVPLCDSWRGKARMTGLASLEHGSGERISVAVRRLDDWDFRNVRFVKIDVEGHELSVIDGARKTLLRDHPVLLVEIECRHAVVPISTVFSEITSLGYAGWFLLHGCRHRLDDFDAKQHQLRFADSVVGADHPDYVNNFIFEPVA